jgi:DNA-binding SARP family transcriptional activator
MPPVDHLDDLPAAGPPGDARITVLGPVEVFGPGGRALLTGARQRAVVGLLATRVRTVVPAWRMVEALWGDEPPRTALRSLHSHVARVRQAMARCGLPDALVTRDAGYSLMVGREAVDAWCFEEHVRRARAADTDEDAVEQLRRGLRLWRHDIALIDAEPASWGAAEAARLAEVRLTATEERWAAELRLGRHSAAIEELERLLVSHPLRERLVGHLMVALYRAGRQGAALAGSPVPTAGAAIHRGSRRGAGLPGQRAGKLPAGRQARGRTRPPAGGLAADVPADRVLRRPRPRSGAAGDVPVGPACRAGAG